MQLNSALTAQLHVPATDHVQAVAARSIPASAAAPDATSTALTSTYYDTAEGRRGVDLLRSLHTISEEHHRPLSYDAARTALFTTVEDPDDSNVVTD
ncbi:MAG: hypothetical protein JWM98_1130, partial [Thermoleophilia bacterium]|nr:hypothetical protein [Thermoleophilia bacterium]